MIHHSLIGIATCFSLTSGSSSLKLLLLFWGFLQTAMFLHPCQLFLAPIQLKFGLLSRPPVGKKPHVLSSAPFRYYNTMNVDKLSIKG